MTPPRTRRPHDRAQAVVALGGGHGLHASLTALRMLVDDLTVDELTAVVTVADNGGSSGRLRASSACCLRATCGWRSPRSAATTNGAIPGPGCSSTGSRATARCAGHVVGNLLIVGLWELLGDHVDALDWVGRLLGAKGRVLPMAMTPMDITAEVRGIDPARDELVTVRGQVEVATTDGVIASIALDPPDPAVSPAALAAIEEADWAVLGPGSWFSSVIPHLLVPQLRDALVATAARLIVVLNLAEQEGETGGFGPADHLAVLAEHAPDLVVHTVLADRESVGDDAEELRVDGRRARRATGHRRRRDG